MQSNKHAQSDCTHKRQTVAQKKLTTLMSKSRRQTRLGSVRLGNMHLFACGALRTVLLICFNFNPSQRFFFLKKIQVGVTEVFSSNISEVSRENFLYH